MVVAGTGWILGFIIRWPQTSLAAARPTLRATTGAVSREKLLSRKHTDAPRHHTHWTSSIVQKCIRCSGRGSRVRPGIQHDTDLFIAPQCEIFEPCQAPVAKDAQKTNNEPRTRSTRHKFHVEQDVQNQITADQSQNLGGP